ncbi:GNAT family N-acetyltransferase [Paenibacillus sp. JCM 10914]|uniref:GNAT family N-acetyltransferase n=1 Tax=Paenibacillus sp. JCM 10914 TaxID=1236974 RepID=UPI001E48A090|nr:GNAT family protein [Paenibacillus sp. JCM 10914]
MAGRRIRLRRMDAEDAYAMSRCWMEPASRAFADIPVVQSVRDAGHLIQRLNDMALHEETIRWGIERIDTSELLGSCGFNFWQLEGAFRGEFGCELSSKHSGYGYMTEAAGVVAAFGFEVMGLNRIEALVDPRNERASRLFERLGYSREGLLRDYRHTLEGFVSVNSYALLRREWEQAREEQDSSYADSI